MKFSHLADSAPLTMSHRVCTTPHTHNIRLEKSSLRCRVVQETPKTLWAIAISCPPEVEGMSPLMKIPCTLKNEPRGLSWI